MTTLRPRRLVSLTTLFAMVVPGVALLAFTSAHAQRITGPSVNARTVLHPDDTKTESTKDPVKRQQTEKIFDSRGVVIAEKVFLLNQNGDPTQGAIYDGRGGLIARVIFYFDDLGRVVEERCVNTKNEIFRRVIRQYDKSGRAMPPQAFDYKVNAPNMSVAKINFTNMPALPPKDGTRNDVPQQPGQAPQIESAAPGMRMNSNGGISVQPQFNPPPQGGQPQRQPTAPPAAPAEKKSRWFWQKK
ncbi:hypothetical protein [Roseimicrobium sp. ORNL1]|uniref:hypothetical protein n=1 Tax=Roseimicrobium sp. ORNL1 TaxID=2711231 RepID=UPI0013E1D38B|nr:hypothetical protein [Roseimicrobium sp. ORNL1]QIF05135.1 hypothetical protein G5S37_27680 [Roseimicrobium sp. ORNL1]